MRYFLTCGVLVGTLLGALSPAQCGSAVMLKDGSIVAIANNQEGHLQLWKAGSEKPEWTIELTTQGGLQSSVAAIALRGNGEILVIERFGSILTIKPNGKASPQKTPAYEYIKLKGEFSEDILSNWKSHVETVGRTAAAVVSQDAKQLYLVPNELASVRRLSVDQIWKQPNSVFFLTDFFDFMFQDNNIVFTQKNPERPVKIDKTWGVDKLHPTSLAVCGEWLIVGSKEGAVKFIPETGDSAKARLRQVSKQENADRSILDVGCIGPNLAYSVSEDASSQVLLWDLDNQGVVSSMHAGNFGHRGMAFVGVASRSGSHLLTLGEPDIRLWAIENRKLKLVSRYYPETKEPLFTGLPLSSGDFVVWDGQTFWRIPSNGGPPVYYAGKKPARQMKPCYSKEDQEIKCWSVEG